MFPINCWTAASAFVTRARSWLRCLNEHVRPPLSYRFHSGRAEEDAYWGAAARAWKVLQASCADTIPENVPLVRYYTPKLLPVYREVRARDPEALEVHLPPRTFCKWHRMVFPGPVS